ncbi:MAG: hypothetical protein AAF191_21275 [Verrucomicrobiota bacterium]
MAAEARFERDGTYVFALSLEVVASADPEQNDLISPEEAVLQYLRDALTFQFDDIEIEPDFGIPKPVPTEGIPDPFRSQLFTEATGTVPEGSRTFSATLDPEAEVAVVLLVEKGGIRERRARVMYAGETCRAVDLTEIEEGIQEGDPFEERSETAGSFGDGFRDQMAAGYSVVIFLAVLLGTTTAFAVGTQTMAFLSTLLVGQLIARLQLAPLSEITVFLFLGLALIVLAAENLRSQRNLGGVRLGLVLLAGGLVGLTRWGTFSLSHWMGGVSLLGGMAFLFFVLAGNFWKLPAYERWFRRPSSWILIGVALYWCVFGMVNA